MADNPQTQIEIDDSVTPVLATSALQTTGNTRLGDLTETAPGTDTASSGLNGRLQRIAQRITALISTQTDGTQQTNIRGNTTGALIGNLNDALKVATVGELATYSACATGFSVATSPTDVILVKGSATKKVKIRRILLSGYQNNVSYQSFIVIKRSADNTGGTRVSLTPTSYDSSDAAATAQVFRYTANASSLGTAVGTLFNLLKLISGKNSVVSTSPDIISLSTSPQKPIILNNQNEYIALNFNGETMAGAFLSAVIEWTEE